ncbi:MAG: beta-ketoacyl-[acyl-carrier-protein] synthase family protein [Candidatus Limnocylindrales bacterium]
MRQPDFSRRVVVTGLGVVSPVGNDKDTVWSNLLNGVSGLGVITKFDPTPYAQKASGEVHGFDPSLWMDPKALRRSESAMWYGVSAAKQAIADAGLEITDSNREDIGVIFGSGAGGQQLMIDNWHILQDKGPGRVAPTFIANGLVDSTSGMIAIETGAIGHNMCIVTACSTGTNSVGEGAELIRRGDVHTVIAGSTEMPLLEVAHAGFGNMRGLGSPRPGEPITDTSRPFDRSRDGFVLGEGAGGLILEDLEVAMARGARIYAEVVGYGSTADGHDMVQPIEGGAGSARAIRLALQRRGVPAEEIDVINPHGTSTPVGDRREAEAIWAVFGDRVSRSRESLLITATKSMTGHMMGAAGSFEAFATVMTVAEQTAPPTINFREFDPDADVWVVPEVVQRPIRYALSNSIGLGGHNGAIIFKRWDGR